MERKCLSLLASLNEAGIEKKGEGVAPRRRSGHRQVKKDLVLRLELKKRGHCEHVTRTLHVRLAGRERVRVAAASAARVSSKRCPL